MRQQLDVIWERSRREIEGRVEKIETAAIALLEGSLEAIRYQRLTDRAVIIGWTMLENLGYRQLTVVWRLRGLWKYLRGRKDWGAMEWRGLNREGKPPQMSS